MNVIHPLPKGSPTNDPKRIIVHSMSEWLKDDKFYYAHHFLEHIGLSAHAFITPSGVVIKSRTDSQGAYHAKGHNTGTLGVEFLVPGLHNYEGFLRRIVTPYLTTAQFDAGIKLVRLWMLTHKINKQNIYRHSDIDPERKQDPGEGFPWDKFLESL